MSKIARFLLKPASEKRITARFFSRKALSKLPFAPIESRLTVASGEELRFWWSYISDVNHPERSFTTYWGDDCGELRFLWQFLEPGMTFFDVGAYHGMFSVLAGSKLSRQGEVVAFEPSSRERRRLKFHLQMNGLRNVRVEPYAVSSTSGKLKFFAVTSVHTSMNSLRPPADQAARETAVEAIALDEYLQQHGIGRVDIMKIDVEGGELQAFSGSTQLLASIRPILICEVLDWVTRPWGYEARQIIDRLRTEGYDWFDFRDNGTLQPHEPRSVYPEIRNYLAVPREKLGLVERWRIT